MRVKQFREERGGQVFVSCILKFTGISLIYSVLFVVQGQMEDASIHLHMPSFGNYHSIQVIKAFGPAFC